MQAYSASKIIAEMHYMWNYVKPGSGLWLTNPDYNGGGIRSLALPEELLAGLATRGVLDR